MLSKVSLRYYCAQLNLDLFADLIIGLFEDLPGDFC